MLSNRIRSLILIAMTCLGSSAIAGNTIVDVSVNDYNQFVLPEPYSSITFPPKSPLRSPPIPIAGQRGFLLLLEEKASINVQMVVELESGETFSLTLKPKNIPGITYRYKDALGKETAKADVLSFRPSDEWLVNVFKSVLDNSGNSKHAGPEGFTQGGELAIATIGPIRGKPICHWRSPKYKLVGYRLTSDTPINIEPADFYLEGVVAVLVETDVVSPEHSPRLYALMEITDDR